MPALIKDDLLNNKPSFGNTEIAFRHQSDTDLNRAYWLFKIIGSRFLTAIGPPMINFAFKLGLPLERLVKATIFRQFCGGETIAECEPVIGKLASGNVGTILDYSVEGEECEAVFDETAEEIIRTIQRAEGDTRIPLAVFKMTGIARFGLLEKISARQELSVSELAEFGHAEARVERICQAAVQVGMRVMVDAEESWIQPAIDDLVMQMMRKHNREVITVYNTYQLYRHDKLEMLMQDINCAQNEGFLLGAKLVRGAYMEKERERAEELVYPSPIHPDKEATDRDYNEALAYCVSNIVHVGLVCGTHNEESCRLLVQLLATNEIACDHRHIWFSQLYGMSDHVSFNLAEAGYNVAKYVPYGPVKAVLPYLFRRAKENTAIAGQTGRELCMIMKERKRRRLN